MDCLNIETILNKHHISSFYGRRLALVMPYYNFHDSISPGIHNDNSIEGRECRVPPLGLYSILNNLKDIVDCKIFDCNLYSENSQFLADLENYLCEGDILGVSSYTRTYPLSVEILNHFPDDYVLKILGGPYITSMPDLRFAHLIIRGEGEIPLRQFLLHPDSIKSIPGLYFWLDNAIYDNGIYTAEDITKLHSPAYKAINWDNYFMVPFLGKVTMMITSRGCNGKCTYCDTIKNQRFLPLEQILNDICEMKANGANAVYFWDDNLLARPRSHLEAIFTYLEENALSFGCFGRVDTIDRDMINLLISTSCDTVFLGLESGDDQIRRFYNKPITRDQLDNVRALIDSNTVSSELSIIFGAPMETKTTIDKGIKLLRDLKPTIPIINPLLVNPGTPIYNYAVKHGLIQLQDGRFEADYERYGLDEPMGIPPISRITIESSNPSDAQLRKEKRYLNERIQEAYQLFRYGGLHG